MLDQLWTSILDVVAQLVTPDWGAIIAFLPILILVLTLPVLIVLLRRLMKAPPARRGKTRVASRTPAGIHLPGPSFAPAFAAMGTFLLFLGLVFGGVTLTLGIIALVLTLLYWLAEGLRIYDKDIGPTTETLPAVIHEGPPPGVHLPGPSWRPVVGAVGVFLLFLGLVFGGWLLPVGVIALIATLVGWLPDAIGEYGRTVEADTTGHLENGPPPRVPSRLLAVLTVLAVGAAILQSSVFATGQANGGTASPGASEAPATGGPPASGGPGASGGPPGSGGPPASAPTADVQVQAQGIKFLEASWTAPADKPFTIAFSNEDPGTPHNIELKNAADQMVFRGDVFNGVETRIYDVPAQPAGEYKFLCTVHPTMTGTATLQ